MSKTGNFLIELTDYVWLIEFAGLTFEKRGKAIEAYRKFLADKFGDLSETEDFSGWYDAAYETALEHGGPEWATGKHAERLLGMVS